MTRRQTLAPRHKSEPALGCACMDLVRKYLDGRIGNRAGKIGDDIAPASPRSCYPAKPAFVWNACAPRHRQGHQRRPQAVLAADRKRYPDDTAAERLCETRHTLPDIRIKRAITQGAPRRADHVLVTDQDLTQPQPGGLFDRQRNASRGALQLRIPALRPRHRNDPRKQPVPRPARPPEAKALGLEPRLVVPYQMLKTGRGGPVRPEMKDNVHGFMRLMPQNRGERFKKGQGRHSALPFAKSGLTGTFSRFSLGFAFAIGANTIISCPTGGYMKSVFFLFALALAAFPAKAQETGDSADPSIIMSGETADLSEFKWINRPLVVFADSPADPRYVQQMEYISDRLEDLEDRDVVVLTDTDPDADSALRERLH